MQPSILFPQSKPEYLTDEDRDIFSTMKANDRRVLHAEFQKNDLNGKISNAIFQIAWLKKHQDVKMIAPHSLETYEQLLHRLSGELAAWKNELSLIEDALPGYIKERDEYEDAHPRHCL